MGLWRQLPRPGTHLSSAPNAGRFPSPHSRMLTPVADEDLTAMQAQALAFGESTQEGAGQGCFTQADLAEGETVARDTAVLYSC